MLVVAPDQTVAVGTLGECLEYLDRNSRGRASKADVEASDWPVARVLGFSRDPDFIDGRGPAFWVKGDVAVMVAPWFYADDVSASYVASSFWVRWTKRALAKQAACDCGGFETCGPNCANRATSAKKVGRDA